MADEIVNEAEPDAFSGLAEPGRPRPPPCQHETRGRKRRGVSLPKDLRFTSTSSDTIEQYEAQMGTDHQAKVSFRAPARPNELTSKNMREHVSTAQVIQTDQNSQQTVRDDPILGAIRGKREGCLKQVFPSRVVPTLANLDTSSHLPVDTVSRDVWPCPILQSTEIRECGNTEYWVQIDGTLDWTNKHSLAGFHDDLRQNGTCLQDQRFNAKSANCGTSLVSYVFGYHPQQTDAKHTNMYNEVSPVGLLCEYFSMKRNIGYCRILFTALLSRASRKW